MCRIMRDEYSRPDKHPVAEIHPSWIPDRFQLRSAESDNASRDRR